MADRLRIVAVIQARTGSVRLPGKVIADVEGVPLLARVVRRLRRAAECDEFAIATTTETTDDAVARLAAAEGIRIVRGPLTDVLERYRLAATELRADAIVRVTGDCPLIDPAIVDRVVRRFRDRNVDYASNVHPPTFPDGLDVEVISRAAIERSAAEAMLASEREHVTLHITSNGTGFTQTNISRQPDVSAMRWTVDYADDLEFIRAVYRHFGRSDEFSADDVLAALETDTELAALMPRRTRNEAFDPNDTPR